MAMMSTVPPDDFTDLVRDALLHIHDPAHLQTHPLGELVLSDRASPGIGARGRLLFQALLDAIELTRPSPGTRTGSRDWRVYSILEQRYIDGREIADVADAMGIGKNQYHRDHRRALRAVASILWDRKSMSSPSARAAEEPAATPSPDDLTQVEVRRLLEGQASAGGPQEVDPLDVVRGIADLIRPLCQRHYVEVHVDSPDQLPPVFGERVALRQALLTFLVRVISSSRDGGVRIEALGRPGRLEIHIKGSTSSEPGAIHRGIAESLPFVEALGGQMAETQDTSRDWAVSLSFPLASLATLLVVDNSSDFVRLVERYLDGSGWEVIGTSDVEQAFDLAVHEHVAAVLLDVIMPGRDGWELLQALKGDAATKGVPVIICSVLDSPELAISLGADAYLQKPIDRQMLVEALMPYCP